jgi:hypothetical protein
MKRVLIAILITFAGGSPPASLACGACDEDRVAATYDHAVINAAMARHQRVVFVAVDGPVSAEKLAARIAAAANWIPGVQKGTLRTSASPLAFSFALDAAREPAVAVSDFRRAVGNSSTRLTLVRIVRDGAMMEPK